MPKRHFKFRRVINTDWFCSAPGSLLLLSCRSCQKTASLPTTAAAPRRPAPTCVHRISVLCMSRPPLVDWGFRVFRRPVLRSSPDAPSPHVQLRPRVHQARHVHPPRLVLLGGLLHGGGDRLRGRRGRRLLPGPRVPPLHLALHQLRHGGGVPRPALWDQRAAPRGLHGRHAGGVPRPGHLRGHGEGGASGGVGRRVGREGRVAERGQRGRGRPGGGPVCGRVQRVVRSGGGERGCRARVRGEGVVRRGRRGLRAGAVRGRRVRAGARPRRARGGGGGAGRGGPARGLGGVGRHDKVPRDAVLGVRAAQRQPHAAHARRAPAVAAAARALAAAADEARELRLDEHRAAGRGHRRRRAGRRRRPV
ncbi:hypothetical protein DFJ74DRAFT_726283 [Hyaloraphidium curvatum]|nr:hypothetical protein DFJ74DRAFT_726283 [Hyaloraphidium curvatum]